MKKIFLLLILAHQLAAQTDFNNLSWKFRGPENYDLGAKSVIDIATDPNNDKQLWAATLEDGLLYNDNVIDQNSEWKKATLPNKRVYKLKFDPTKPLNAYAIGDFTNWKTTDGGKTWSELTAIQGSSRLYDIWVSKVGNVVAATKNEVFISNDKGLIWKRVFVENSRTIRQLWVQENERIYVLKDDNTGLYSDAPYASWKDISLAQMRKEEMPFAELEEFHAYIVQSGEVFHGFTTVRKNILLDTKYSIDGGSTYKTFIKPNNINEIVFVGEDIVFATKNGIFAYKNNVLQERNKGLMQGEFKLFAKRNTAGDNYFAGISSKGMFVTNNSNKIFAVEIATRGEVYNHLTSNITENCIAVEENKINYIGYSHLEGRQIIPLANNISLVLTNDGKLGRWVGNKVGNLSEGTLSIIKTDNSPLIDIFYNSNINVVYGLLKDGRFVRIQTPDAVIESTIKIVYSTYKLPFANLDEGLIEEISADGNQILVTDKSKNLYVIIRENNTERVQAINTNAFKDLKINHLEFSLKYQKLFLATEKGFFMGEDILSNTPKWTNISKEIGEQPCTYIQLRTLDGQLAVMTRFKGIYSTSIFSEPNQIITLSPNYFNVSPFSPLWGEPLTVGICNDSKIKIDFITNIPANPAVKYVVEVSDANGNFPATPIILKGESISSPVEVTFIKPQVGIFSIKFRVLARGAVQATGTTTQIINVFDQTDIKPFATKSIINCDKESIELTTPNIISYAPYTWQKDGKSIVGATEATFKTDQVGTYTRVSESNGCIINTIFEVSNNPNLQASFKPNIGFSYAGNTCVVDSFKLFSDFNNTYSYQWLRDNLELKNLNKSEVFVKDKSIYKLIVTNLNGCKYISEPIQLKTCENTTENRAILLNPPKITADKISIYPNEKSILSTEGCPNVNLQWLKDTKPILGANQKTIEVKETGNYALQIEKFGCVATTSSLKISVENVLAVGEELPEISIEVYPNPTDEKLFISIPSQINGRIDAKMIDIAGKFIEKYEFTEKRSQFINLNTLQEGVYFLTFEMNGKRIVKKIVKN